MMLWPERCYGQSATLGVHLEGHWDEAVLQMLSFGESSSAVGSSLARGLMCMAGSLALSSIDELE